MERWTICFCNLDLDGFLGICRSTGSGPEPLGPELVAEGQKPKGNALSALVNNPIKKPGALPQAEVRPRRWR